MEPTPIVSSNVLGVAIDVLPDGTLIVRQGEPLRAEAWEPDLLEAAAQLLLRTVDVARRLQAWKAVDPSNVSD